LNVKAPAPGERRFYAEGVWPARWVKGGTVKVLSFFACEEILIKRYGGGDPGGPGAAGAAAGAGGGGHAAFWGDLKAIGAMAGERYLVGERAARAISDREGAEGAFMACEYPAFTMGDIQMGDDGMVMVLDGLETPGNVGACVRSAAAAGCAGVVIVNRKAGFLHSRSIRSSLGAGFIIPVVEADMGSFAAFAARVGLTAFVNDLRGDRSVFGADYGGKVALVTGNEHAGVSPLWEGLGGGVKVVRVRLPMADGVDSLNAGFAAALTAYEAARFKGLLR